jgi:hypothetical protein
LNTGHDNIKMYLKGKSIEGTHWVQLPQDRKYQRSIVCKVMSI